MGKGIGDSSWAKKWFSGRTEDGLQQCIFVDADGKRCPYTNSCRFCTSLSAHLRKHDVDRHTPVPKSTMKSLEEYWKDQCPTLDSDERWILLLARHGFPATLLDDPEFRDLTKTKISRNCVPKMMEDLSKKLMDAAFSFVKEGTLAIDVGTVHRRFLAFVFVTKGKSIFLKLREDAEAGGVLTIEAVYNETQRVVSELRSRGIYVRNIVADNASNLQGISKYSPDGDVSEVEEGVTDDDDDLKAEMSKLPLVTRCACHVIQLVVKDVSSIWQSAYESAKEILLQAHVKRTACETRWNSKYMVIKAAIAHCDGHERRDLEEAAEFLRPFAVMTRALESDSATLFKCVAIVERFFQHLQRQKEKLNDGSPLGRLRAQALATLDLHSCKRFAMLFNTPYVILAFFSPSTDYNAPLTIAMESTVRTEMEKLDSSISLEWKIFSMKQIDPAKDVPITKELYEAHLAKHFSTMPAISKVVRGLLNGSPSEAAVERMFSQLKFTFDQWRSRSSNSLMNHTLQITSAYRYFNSKCFREPTTIEPSPQEPEVMQTPKRHRSEANAQATPTTAGNATPSEAIELESESEDEEDFDEASEVHSLFDGILKWALERQHQAPAAPSPAADGKRTRQAADACIDCGRPCRQHPNLGYLECQVCHARRSVTHLPRYQNMQGSNTHDKMDVAWVCEKCSKHK